MEDVRIYVAHPQDSVGTVFGRPVLAGETVPVSDRDAGDGTIRAATDIPSGHKIALLDVGAGEPVLKYGHPIGRAVQPIERGEHVHVHNIESERGRGDLVREES